MKPYKDVANHKEEQYFHGLNNHKILHTRTKVVLDEKQFVCNFDSINTTTVDAFSYSTVQELSQKNHIHGSKFSLNQNFILDRATINRPYMSSIISG